jgi:hypothetical protein
MGELVVERQFTRAILIVDHECVMCHKTFRGPESREYCSMPCRRRAAYLRRRQKLADQGQGYDPARTYHVDWETVKHD